MERPIVALLFVVGLVAVASAQTSGACNRECLIGLTEAYLSAMVARDPAKAPVIANVRARLYFGKALSVRRLPAGRRWFSDRTPR